MHQLHYLPIWQVPEFTMHYHTALLSFMLIITTLPFTISQTVAPFPYHDCSQEIVYTGDHTCNNDPTTCCAASGECCAGGCCSYDSTCVFQGTENEACCPLSDKTGCGSNPPVSLWLLPLQVCLHIILLMSTRLANNRNMPFSSSTKRSMFWCRR